MKEIGNIEIGIMQALSKAQPGSNQELQAKSLKVFFDALRSGGFEDPHDKNEVKVEEKALGQGYSKNGSKDPQVIVTVGLAGYLFKDSGEEIPVGPEEMARRPEIAYANSLFTHYPGESQVLVGGEKITLGTKENAVLELLTRYANTNVTFEMFDRNIWGEQACDLDTQGLLKKYIQRLRGKIAGTEKERPRFIISVRGIGYRLYDEDKRKILNSPTILETPSHIEGVTVYDRSLEEGVVYHHSKYSHDREFSNIVVAGEEKGLTRTENRLLTVLEESPNKIRSKTELCKRVFGEGYSDENIKKYILDLRQKIESDAKIPEVIISARGQGYLLRDPSRKTREVLVKQEETIETVYSHPGFTYHPERSLVVVNGIETSLTAKENQLLGLLARNTNRTVTHERFKQIWEDKEDADVEELIKTYMKRLRRKIEPDKRGRDYQYILSTRDIGYRLYDPSVS